MLLYNAKEILKVMWNNKKISVNQSCNAKYRATLLVIQVIVAGMTLSSRQCCVSYAISLL